jgi:C4-dicarboxylate-specific signal transduction histidine kinase
MQGWQIALVVLVAVALGALIPLVVQLYGTLHVLREVAEKSAKDVEQAVAAIHRTAERVDKLGAALEKDGKMAEIIDGMTAAAQVMNQVRGTLSVAGPIAAAVVPAVAAAVKAWKGGMEGDAPEVSHHEKKEAEG